MVYRRRKNNKARKILRRIRKRHHRASARTKGLKKLVKKVMTRASERHLAYEQPAITGYNPQPTGTGVAYQCNVVFYEAWCPTNQESLSTTVDGVTGDIQTVSLNRGQAYRQGVKIENIFNTAKFRIEMNSTSTLNWYVRVVVFKPKLLSDITDAQDYMNAVFGPLTLGAAPGANIFSKLDDTQVTILKDTGVVMLNLAENRVHLNFNYVIKKKSIRYTEDSESLPNDRREQIAIIVSSPLNAIWDVWHQRSIYFHDS